MTIKTAATFILGVAAAISLHAPLAAHSPDIEPWSEAVVSVTDLEDSASWLVKDGGWKAVSSGPITPGEIAYWKLPDIAGGAFLKICAPDAQSGCIRFVRFDKVRQRPIRRAARPWDTGGIFSIMVRSEDTHALFDAAINRGWWAESDPYEFSFGGSDLVNVVVRGPHGVNYAVYERKSPEFAGFPVGRLSQAFNSMRMVKDQPASLAFYRDTLGLKVLFDAPFTDPEPRANNFSVPANLATTLVRRAAVAQPKLPGETGRIELMQFEGFDGRDFSQYASPPNLGIISVRYPVKDLATYRKQLEQLGVEIAYETQSLAIAAGKPAPAFAVRDPDGNLTEFYDAE
ncbi:MAG: VOC family protein [Erythrobacter sp.]